MYRTDVLLFCLTAVFVCRRSFCFCMIKFYHLMKLVLYRVQSLHSPWQCHTFGWLCTNVSRRIIPNLFCAVSIWNSTNTFYNISLEDSDVLAERWTELLLSKGMSVPPGHSLRGYSEVLYEFMISSLWTCSTRYKKRIQRASKWMFPSSGEAVWRRLLCRACVWRTATRQSVHTVHLRTAADTFFEP